MQKKKKKSPPNVGKNRNSKHILIRFDDDIHAELVKQKKETSVDIRHMVNAAVRSYFKKQLA